MGSASPHFASLAPPADTDGIPTGEGDWRFTVAVLIASGGARVGVSRVDVARVSDYVWLDITDDVCGAEWTRGAPPSGSAPHRANVGTGSLTLDNTRDPGAFTPWKVHTHTSTGVDTDILHREWRAGALVRFTMHQPGASTTVDSVSFAPTYKITHNDWQPLFTGIVEDWVETIELGRSMVQVSLTEPGALLAAITEERASVGAGDGPGLRLARLLEAADYPFVHAAVDTATPWALVFLGSPGFQATTMTANRWQEVLNVGDTAYAEPVFVGRDGLIMLGQQDGFDYANLFVNAGVSGFHVWPQQLHVPDGAHAHLTFDLTADASADDDRFPYRVSAEYSAQLVITCNADFVVNQATTGRVGSATRAIANDTRSISAYGLRTVERTDLMLAVDADIDDVAAKIVADWSGWNTATGLSSTIDQALQPGQIAVHSQPGSTVAAAVQRLIDLYSATVVDYGDPGDTSPAIRFLGRTLWMNHKVRPVADSDGVVWDSTYVVFSLANYTPEP